MNLKKRIERIKWTPSEVFTSLGGNLKKRIESDKSPRLQGGSFIQPYRISKRELKAVSDSGGNSNGLLNRISKRELKELLNHIADEVEGLWESQKEN